VLDRFHLRFHAFEGVARLRERLLALAASGQSLLKLLLPLRFVQRRERFFFGADRRRQRGGLVSMPIELSISLTFDCALRD
jgi:hypothetical protein